MLDKIFDPHHIELSHYKRWEDSGHFSADPKSNKTPFCIMMPPPNVTGTLHMGHAFTTTLQDILTRYKRMKNFDALWLPGTDHAGIATQMVVERQLDKEGLNRREMGREAFLKRVWDWKSYSGGTITSQLRRLGSTADWSRERFTMDEDLSHGVRTAFVELYRQGLIYKDNRLVNWDPKLLTAISDLEVEQRDVKGHMWYINYPVEGDQERFITIATTRPETMLGDTAIAVHPEDERYKDLIGKFAILPLVGRPIKIIADAYVDPEAGTGAMKITPAHDFNDFDMGKRHGLEMINIFDRHACINENAPEDYVGMDRFKAREKILSELEQQDLLVKVESITHTVPHGDRSGVVIEPFLTLQWYCDTVTLAKPALEAVETGKTVFVPKNWENTYFEWMRNIQPWCISRQLWWGHRIPAWYNSEGDFVVALNEAEAKKLAAEKWGEGVKITQDEDVLDTWFSSALWPFSTLGWPHQTEDLKKYYSTDVLVTGFDIIFFWVARMMMMGLHFMKEVPFRTVYIHALVRDAKGQKMSKSKGNVMDPLELTDKYGTDALRFTLAAMAAQGRDIKLAEERVEGYRNFATKLWNASRYSMMNGCLPRQGFDPSSVSDILNQWIVSELIKTKSLIETALEDFKFNEAANAIYQFAWGTFCDWYLEFTKPLLSESNTNDALKQETRDTTGWILDQILVLLNPFMPFITEELYEALAVRPKDQFLFVEKWPDYNSISVSNEASQNAQWLIKAISDIRSVRSDMNVPASAQIALLVKDANSHTQYLIEIYKNILLRMARLSSIELTAQAPKGSLQTIVHEATFILPIADIIDLDKERGRLKKEIERLSHEIGKVDQKLANQDFIAKAAPDIIEEQKLRKQQAELTIQKLSQALTQLEAA
jgi:valyl-tRNA synthetase